MFENQSRAAFTGNALAAVYAKRINVDIIRYLVGIPYGVGEFLYHTRMFSPYFFSTYYTKKHTAKTTLEFYFFTASFGS